VSLASIKNTSLIVRSDALRRGSLVEFKVKLKADPVFHLGTMLSEISAMAEDYPDMFVAGNGLETLRQAQPVNKILQRLLAGLIPIRAETVDYSVVTLDGDEHVVHSKLLEGLDIEKQPLEIVGVTEHLAYWKDIRRVLFSDTEFTLMGRVARDSLDDTWTPVKLADLFHEVVPDLVHQINSASRAPFGAPQLVVPPVGGPESKLAKALRQYADSLLAESGKELTELDSQRVTAQIADLKARNSSMSDQCAAFRNVKELLSQLVNVVTEPERDLELREAARASAGLGLFPALNSMNMVSAKPSSTDPVDSSTGKRLLDVEVIAIYW
jgi:hypothetical protein